MVEVQQEVTFSPIWPLTRWREEQAGVSGGLHLRSLPGLALLMGEKREEDDPRRTAVILSPSLPSYISSPAL